MCSVVAKLGQWDSQAQMFLLARLLDSDRVVYRSGSILGSAAMGTGHPPNKKRGSVFHQKVNTLLS